jgi:hypothetical protein
VQIERPTRAFLFKIKILKVNIDQKL